MKTSAAEKAPSDAAAELGLPSLSRARGVRLHKRCACGAGAGQSGECDTCGKQKLALQRRASSASSLGGIPASVEQTLAQPGRPLDSSSRRLMETRFGRDFSAVRLHDDASAGRSAHDVHALAYTVGQDIVFAPGHYQPGTHAGRHLLAHELAHTVQQRGLQRSGTPSLADQGPEYRRLEREADWAADAVSRGGFDGPMSRATAPVLSRTPPGAPPPAAAPLQPPIVISTAELGSMTFVVTPAGAATAGGAGPAQSRFTADTFYLPGQKGERARTIYERFAQERQLQVILQIAGTSAQRTAQWQQRAAPDRLGNAWVQSVRWPAADRDTNWQGLSGGTPFPQTSAGTCNMDHIIELQIAGGNDPGNMQALDGGPNQFSGRAIWNEMRELGTAVAQRFAIAPGGQAQIMFGSITVRGSLEPHLGVAGQPNTCLMIDHLARQGAESRPVTGSTGAPSRSVRLDAGGSVNDFVVPTNWGSANRDAPLSTEPANAAAAQMISGLVFTNLRFVSANAAAVAAQVDPRTAGRGTRLPITMEGGRGNTVQLDATKQAGGAAGAVVYRLGLADHTTNIAFNYTFLSPGWIKRVGISPDGSVHFSAEIDTGVPFLPRPLLVIYEGGVLRLAVALDRSRLRSPIPGFRLTDGRLELGLSPLSASGFLAAAFGGSESHPLVTARAEIGAGANGITGTAVVLAHLPSVDEASGTLTYTNGVWAGRIVVESTQIRIPNVQRGRLQVDIDAGGVRPSGEVELLLPRNLGNVTLGVVRRDSRIVYNANGLLRVPGLREVTILGSYDGHTLRIGAEDIAFTWHGLDGSIGVVYVWPGQGPGAVSGHGRLRLARGGVTGVLDVTLHDSGRYSGSGRLSYPFNIRGQQIEASAGVIVDEAQNVRVEGAIRFPQPIELFRRFGDNKELFHFHRSFPIPGLSIGPVGVVAVIEGGVSARYGFGPGQLRNVALEAAFNPLAEHIDPNVSFHCDLYVPAEAGIAGTIGGGIGVEAGLGRVEGTLSITADLGLNAVLGGPLDLRYENHRFNVTARPGIDASLALGLSLDAHARAEAGIGPFTIGTEKSWNLGRRSVVLGRFSMHAPIAWSSEGGFTAPTMDQIEWGPMPEIDAQDLLRQLFQGSSATERQA